MIGGGAYVAGKHVQQGREREAEQEARIQQLEAQQYQAPAAAPPPPPPAPVAAAPAAPPAQDDLTAKLMQLKGLMDQGVLTADEFAAAKAKLLGV
jgi:Short C-terminal domain